GGRRRSLSHDLGGRTRRAAPSRARKRRRGREALLGDVPLHAGAFDLRFRPARGRGLGVPKLGSPGLLPQASVSGKVARAGHATVTKRALRRGRRWAQRSPARPNPTAATAYSPTSIAPSQRLPCPSRSTSATATVAPPRAASSTGLKLSGRAGVTTHET